MEGENKSEKNNSKKIKTDYQYDFGNYFCSITDTGCKYPKV